VNGHQAIIGRMLQMMETAMEAMKAHLVVPAVAFTMVVNFVVVP
jgi:hypothetical protein